MYKLKKHPLVWKKREPMEPGAANLSLDLGMRGFLNYYTSKYYIPAPKLSLMVFGRTGKIFCMLLIPHGARMNHGVFQVLLAKALRTHDKRDQRCSPKPARSLQEYNGEGLHLEGWKEIGVGGLEINLNISSGFMMNSSLNYHPDTSLIST